ncbi:uncharacterized protein LOC143891894 [Tasmannia lanceolata]|uniref:uncharacterized protein LOC143891894 n=1 Tax=Tasmannia lanceolata TaxID=3420 RepID=UPI00406474E9
MGYIYEAMDRAKENIKPRLKNKKSDYAPIWRIIDQRYDKQLHSPLHAAGYFLNPALFFSPTFSKHHEVTRGLIECINRLVLDEVTQDTITSQIENNRESTDVCNEDGNPQPRQIGTRILSQTCSATGCERNWNTFEHIHSAKRNRLEHQRLNDLVFVHYNLKFRERDLNRRSSTTSDPLSIDHLDVMMDWVAEDEDVILTPNDIGWENIKAPSRVDAADDDDEDANLEDTPPRGGGDGDDEGYQSVEYDDPQPDSPPF